MWRDGESDYYIDAYNESTSSWLRWVNCARHIKEQNVNMYECMGKVFYVNNRDLYPGQELLVYYGDEYAEDQLDINTKMYKNADVDIAAYKRYACWNL